MSVPHIKGVRNKWVEFRENACEGFLSTSTKKTVRNIEMSVLGGCPYSGVRLYIVTSFHPV